MKRMSQEKQKSFDDFILHSLDSDVRKNEMFWKGKGKLQKSYQSYSRKLLTKESFEISEIHSKDLVRTYRVYQRFG